MIIVSACLAGLQCRWDGKKRFMEGIGKLVEEGKAIAVCPETLGGLPVPREPAEIVGGGGGDVLDGKAKVLTKQGVDFTWTFIKGATETLKIAKGEGIQQAIFKSRSSSCGRDQIYDGTFTHTLKMGDGVATALLLREGIKVITDEEFQMKT